MQKKKTMLLWESHLLFNNENMIKALEKNKNPWKYYDTWSIFWWAFLGGPLVATYFLAENFKAIWEEKYVRTTYIGGVVFTILLFAALFVFPENIIKSIPGYIIPIFYSSIAQGIFNGYQKKKIDLLKKENFTHFSIWRVLWITLIWLIITFLPIYWISYLSTPQLITKTYGVTNNIIDSINIKNEEIDSIEQKLEVGGFFDNSSTKRILIKKEWEYYSLYLGIKETDYNNKEVMDSMWDMKKWFQEIFPDKKIKLIIINGDNQKITKEIN